MNENDAYIFHVETPEKWTFPGGKVWVSGWFVSKIGAVFRDMRLLIDDRPYTGIFGVSRPEIEQKYRGWVGLPHAGFAFLVEPAVGAKWLRLELLDHGNNWVEIWRQPIKVPRGRGSKRPRLDPAQVTTTLKTLLKDLREHPAWDRKELTAAARRLALETATEPLNVLPSPPFWGALENPTNFGHSQFGKLPVTGWIIHLEKKIVRLTASADPLIEHVLVYGHPREDAAKMFPEHPEAAKSQFFGMVDLIEDLPNPAFLNIYAYFEDGSRHLVFVQRFRQLSCNDKERLYPAYNRATFWRVVRALWDGSRSAHVAAGSWRKLFPAIVEAYRSYQAGAAQSLAHLSIESQSPYDRWLRHNRLAPPLAALLRTRAEELRADGPTICVLADARDCSATQLQELAATLVAQFYPKWQLALVLPHDAPTDVFSAARILARDDTRIRVQQASARNFAAALTTAARASNATHLTLVPGHSRLSADALLQIAEVVARQPDVELVYTDEDRMDDAGKCSDPKFKPDWSPALALSGLFPGNLSVVRQDRFVEAGAFRESSVLVPWYDVLLRIGDKLATEKVAHAAYVCHHARASVPATTDLAHPSIEQARAALAETFERRHWPAEPNLPEIAHHRRIRFHQPAWKPGLLAQTPVTIVIPTRDRLHLLQECFELLNETVDWRHVKLIIVDDHSRDADAVKFLEMIQRRPELSCKVVRPANPSAPFNYSHLVNLALPLIDTPLVLHLNNDVNALEPGWLEHMVGWMSQPDVGVVGAKLLYPDKSLNHSGIVVGPHGGLADTPFIKLHERDLPELEWHSAAREVSAVTGACLLTRTELYRKLGGFDEKDLGVAYNDVDYCLRVHAAGYRIIYTPAAKLMHWGSATRGVTFDAVEHVAFLKRYPSLRDPYLNPSLVLRDARLEPSVRHYVHAARRGSLRLLLITHNLNLEGAPLFLLEYATYLVKQAGFSIEVLSCQEGPLRSSYEALGAKITLVDRHRIYAAQTPAEFAERVAEVRKLFDFEKIDLVICNTLVSYWGIHLAEQARRPSLFYIHESSSIFRFFEKMLPLPMHAMVNEAFQRATRALFLCRATEAYYKDLDVRGNFRIVPSWIQIEAITQFQRQHTRAELRRRHGYRDDEVIIANIGTVCERKGQHTFIRAVEHFNHVHHGGAGYRFLLVGGRAGIYLDLIEGEIKRMGITNIDIVMETRDAYHYFGLADMFVCSSFEESFPRVVLEAMAFQTPIVSTDVHGIPEMVTQRQDAYLVPPGDHLALSRMMKTCLDKERSGKSLAPAAYSRVLRFYDFHKVLPYHVELAREATLDFE
ncbi:MAG TPA: glycosyltransferase [Candidatus Didemnitutus sp.]|nr:glycosyltransferase [Candidatus Didemnitutus sp.]